MLNRAQFHVAVSPHSTWSSLRAYLGSVFRVDGDDVPLQVLLEVVGVKRIRSIGLVSVLQSNGSAAFVIEIHKEVGSELCWKTKVLKTLI